MTALPPEAFLDDLPRQLRAAGLPIAPDMVRDFLRALAVSPVETPRELYWIARTVFLKHPEALPGFDRAFRDWLHGLTPPEFERWSGQTTEDEQRIDERGSSPSAVRLETGEGGGQPAADADA